MATITEINPRRTRRIYTAVADEIFHPDYELQIETWDMMSDVYEGPLAVLDNAEKYLIVTELEQKELNKTGRPGLIDKKTRYAQRLERSPYFNGIERLTRYAMAHLFREEPKVPSLPSELQPLITDADKLGNPLQKFIRHVCNWSYVMGHYYILVDMPITEGVVESLQDQKELALYPYFVAIDPRDIINWKMSQRADGSYGFDWAVHRQANYTATGPFDEAEYEVVYKVWYPDKWELYSYTPATPSDKGGRTLLSEGANPLGEVPLVPVYSNFVRPMVSQPVLLESARLTLNLFNVYSMLINGLMFHVNPLLAFSGTSPENVKRAADYAVYLPQSAEARYVEFTGNSLNVGAQIADKIAVEVMEAGLRNQSYLGANTSAEARRLAKADFTSFLTSLAGTYEQAFAKALDLAGKWMDLELTEEQRTFAINTDFDVVMIDAGMAEFLLKARMQGELSKETFLATLQRGEVISTTLDIKEEMGKAESDGPSESVVASIKAAEAKAAAPSATDGGATNSRGGGGTPVGA